MNVSGKYLKDEQENIISPITNTDTIFNSKGDNLNTLLKQYQDKLVVFGDSWSALDVEAAAWSPLAASSLNCTLKNYAINGAGFVNPTTNLMSTQIQTFIDDTTVDKDTVKYIVLFGGINDYRNEVSITDLRDEIVNCIISLKSYCHYAKILYVSNCQYPFTASQSGYWLSLHNHISTLTGIATYNLDGTIGRAIWNKENYFHPTKSGSELIGRNIVCCLTGGEIVNYMNDQHYSDTNGNIGYVIYRRGDVAHFDFKVRFSKSVTSWTTGTISPNICYYDLLTCVFGGVIHGYKTMLIDASAGNKIAIVLDGAPRINADYRFSVSAPIAYLTK